MAYDDPYNNVIGSEPNWDWLINNPNINPLEIFPTLINDVKPDTPAPPQSTAPWANENWFKNTDWNKLTDNQLNVLFGSQPDLQGHPNLRGWYDSAGKNEVLNGSRRPNTDGAFYDSGYWNSAAHPEPAGSKVPNIDWGDPNALRRYNAELWGNLNLDDYKHDPVTPQQYNWLSDFNPTNVTAAQLGQSPSYTASLVGGFSPYATVGYEGLVGDQSRIDTTAQDQSRNAQLDNLSQWDFLAREGLNADERSAVENVNNAAMQARGRADRAILDDMAARGTLGSGSELAQRLNASSQAANLANRQGMDLEQAMLNRRGQALQAGGQLASQMRGQDQSLAAQQAQLFENYQQRRENIINTARQYAAGQQNQANAAAFGANVQGAMANAQAKNQASQFNAGLQNQRDIWNATSQNEASRYNADAKNKADLFNVTGRQNLANQNVAQNNEYARWNQTYGNQLTGMRNQDRLTALPGFSNALNGQATGVDRQNFANAQQNAANTAMWVNGGARVLGSALDNWDTIADGAGKAVDWLSGLF